MKVRYMRKDFWWMGDRMEKQCHRRLKPLPGMRWKRVNGKPTLVKAMQGFAADDNAAWQDYGEEQTECDCVNPTDNDQGICMNCGCWIAYKSKA